MSGSRPAKGQAHRDDGTGPSRPAVTIRSSAAALPKTDRPFLLQPNRGRLKPGSPYYQSTGHHVWCRWPSQLCRFEIPLQAMRIDVSLKLKS